MPAPSPQNALPPLLRLPPARAAWAVAGPMVLLGWFRSGYFLANSFWVSRLTEADLAALGSCAFAFWSINLWADLAGTGLHALVAQAEGAADRARIGRLLGQGLWLVLSLAIGLVVLADPLAAFYLDVMRMPRGPVFTAAETLLDVSLLLALPIIAQTLGSAVFRGLGDTRTPLLVAAATLVLNVVVDPVLIWGVGPWPGLGLRGVAVGTATAATLGAVLSFWLLWRRSIRPEWRLPQWSAISEIVRIGLPITASGLFFCGVYLALGRTILPLGAEHMAALGVGHRVESFAYQVCVGFQVAAATLVGQWVGAGDRSRAAAAAEDCAGAATRWMLGAGVLLVLLADPIFRFYAEDGALGSGRLYLWTQAAVFVFMAWECVYEGAFTGLGRTIPPLVVGMVFTALRVPLAAALSVPLDIVGVWLAIAASTLIKGVLVRWWFRAEQGGSGLQR